MARHGKFENTLKMPRNQNTTAYQGLLLVQERGSCTGSRQKVKSNQNPKENQSLRSGILTERARLLETPEVRSQSRGIILCEAGRGAHGFQYSGSIRRYSVASDTLRRSSSGRISSGRTITCGLEEDASTTNLHGMLSRM